MPEPDATALPGVPAQSDTQSDAPALPGALRAPQQARSREKVARILAATARLLAELPYAELGTKRIAAEAGVSVGMLYRFFPDKHAIATALAADWLDRFVASTERVLASSPATPELLLARLLDAQAEFRRAQPGFRRLWYAGPALPALREHDERTDRTIAELVHRALVRDHGYPDSAEFALRTRLAVRTAAGLLNQAFEQDPEGDPAVLTETRLMLERWLLHRPDTPKRS
ncbi:TetR/AcrR family transcriptional regulator [Kitasatospora viridis]|uniref:TetR family transcriptional regulator n=1 Tax=Kitasatospora viridis TaxID=281105 RepID=A0A561UPD6_9ACTN|nr:TetR/AcrR family transcriptional regulator [Kitasatospora viridis]TWG01211.1 TetR family transcriptional regulator [Kitasatospora viridis]